MSDLIRKSETVQALRHYAEEKHCGGEIELANGILKAVCFMEKEENIPTVDEKEIIRKPMERIVERLEEQAECHRNIAFEMEKQGFCNIADKQYAKQGCYLNAIAIVEEEGGV